MQSQDRALHYSASRVINGDIHVTMKQLVSARCVHGRASCGCVGGLWAHFDFYSSSDAERPGELDSRVSESC